MAWTSLPPSAPKLKRDLQGSHAGRRAYSGSRAAGGRHRAARVNALGLRYATLRPGPSFAQARPENDEPQTELLDVPPLVELRLRLRIGEIVAAQAVEDDAGSSATRGQGRYDGCNAVLKRVLGGKGRSEMTLAELEAVVAW